MIAVMQVRKMLQRNQDRTNQERDFFSSFIGDNELNVYYMLIWYTDCEMSTTAAFANTFITSANYCFCFFCCWVTSVVFDSVRPHRQQPTRLPVPGILQERTLEWVAIFFSNAWKWKVKVKLLSRVQPSATPWPAAFQAPPSMGFSRQEY